MGAVPKKKPSKTRSRRRRTTWLNKFSFPDLIICPNCHKWKLPHRVCPSCGYYRNQPILKQE